MAYTLDVAVVLGASNTGLTLEAQLVDTTGASVGSAVTSGFTEIGGGNYLWHYASWPDSHRGGVKFSLSPGGALKAFVAINPEEVESPLQTHANKLATNSNGQPTLRTQDSGLIRGTTAQGGSSTTITLDAGASSVDDYYVGALVYLPTTGTGALQSGRTITAYNGATKVATVDRAWATAPDNTTVFSIRAQDGPALDSSLQVAASLGSSQQVVVANAVWNRATASNNTAGTFGQAVGTSMPATLATITSQLSTVLTNASDILARLGAWTGTGINTVLGAFKAVFRKSGATAPSDIGGTFDPTTDSLEAIRDRGDAAWLSGGGSSGRVLAPAIAQALRDVDTTVAGRPLEARAGDTWDQPVLGLGTLDGRDALYFTVKSNAGAADSTSLLQIEETGGLLYANGAAATSGNGSLTVDDETNGSVTLHVEESVMAALTPGVRYRYSFKMISGGNAETIAVGDFRLTAAGTLAVS